MSEIATKTKDTEPQIEGGRVVGVSPNGKIYRYGGTEQADDEGIAVTNSRWGTRFNFDSE